MSGGATIIEFAIVAFLLFLVIFASFEFDRMMLVYTTLANSARGRYAMRSFTELPVRGPAIRPAEQQTIPT